MKLWSVLVPLNTTAHALYSVHKTKLVKSALAVSEYNIHCLCTAIVWTSRIQSTPRLVIVTTSRIERASRMEIITASWIERASLL